MDTAQPCLVFNFLNHVPLTLSADAPGPQYTLPNYFLRKLRYNESWCLRVHPCKGQRPGTCKRGVAHRAPVRRSSGQRPHCPHRALQVLLRDGLPVALVSSQRVHSLILVRERQADPSLSPRVKRSAEALQFSPPSLLVGHLHPKSRFNSWHLTLQSWPRIKMQGRQSLHLLEALLFLGWEGNAAQRAWAGIWGVEGKGVER